MNIYNVNMGGIDIGMICANSELEAFYRVVNTMGFVDLQSYIDSYPGYDASSKAFERVQSNFNQLRTSIQHPIKNPHAIVVWEINQNEFDYYLDDYFDMRFAVGSKLIQNGAYFTVYPSVKDVKQMRWMWGDTWWFCSDWDESLL